MKLEALWAAASSPIFAFRLVSLVTVMGTFSAQPLRREPPINSTNLV